jgi:hypothetical protein
MILKIEKLEAAPIFERKVAIGEFLHRVPEWDGPLHVIITYENGTTSDSIMGAQQLDVLRSHVKKVKGDENGKDTDRPPGDDGGDISA